MSSTNLHLHTFFSFFLLLSLPSHGLNLDGTLLLSFKYSILSDPLSVLDNWNYNDATPCLWSGVACSEVVNPFGFQEALRVISLTLPNSKLLGNIPEELGFIPYLKTLDLSHNFFNGTLPYSLFNSSKLEALDLSGNAVAGSIPELATKTSLNLLNLSQNALVGSIPHRNIHSLQVLDLSSNLLTGSLPAEFAGENLRYLNLSSNKFSGSVAPGFASKIPANATIDISYNNLSGEIPVTTPLSNQKTEAYAGNADLCGKVVNKLCVVPSSLSPPPNMTANASTAAIAAIPETIGSASSGDTPQSGGQIAVRHGLKPGAVAGIAVVPLAALGVLSALFFYIYHNKKAARNSDKESSIPTSNAYEFKKDSDAKVIKEKVNLPTWPNCLRITNGEETTSEAEPSDSDEIDTTNNITDHPTVDINHNNQIQRSLVMVDGETELEAESLFKASAYVLGSSGATIVYKAVLQDGTAFAVRRVGESGVGRLKEFEQRVKAIAKLRHQNLVRVRGFYWGEDEKLVICDYVSNGSLANIGCRKLGSSPYHLPFQTRLKIAKGVARGLTYIHDKKNVHGNIKPSNILLTSDMEAVISDFGIHLLIYGKHAHKSDGPPRHFGSKRSTSNPQDDLHDHSSPYIGPAGFVGCTSPYHAPESLNNLKPNPKWDVYSFGILLLELLTGKVFSDRELSQWTTSSVAEDPGRILRMADVAIRGDVAAQEEVMLAWFKLGFSCASLVPQKRPCMRDALHVLEKNSRCCE